MENYVRVAVQKALESTLMERPKMELELGSRRRIETWCGQVGAVFCVSEGEDGSKCGDGSAMQKRWSVVVMKDEEML